MTKLPEASSSKGLPSSSYKAGFTPKKGNVAEPGFTGVMPEIGDIKTDPVSVCHQVSITSHLPLPTIL